MRKRIGTFLALVGILLLLLFLVSDSVQSPNFSLLFYGIVLLAVSLVIGVLGSRSNAQPSEPKHFRLVRGRRKAEKIDRDKERRED